MDQDLITRIVEAALLAANQPLTLAQLHSLFPEDQPAPNDSVEQALETLREACADRGVELTELASGFRYQVKADVHAWVSRLWTDRKTKYTRATLETLALIAYRQPITRGEIEQVRGVAVSSNIIQALEEREWIRVVGHRDVPGKPALFGTTKAFLDYFGLKRLDELPPLSELKDIGELEPQLQFDNVMNDPTPIEAGGIAAEPGVESGDAANADDASNDDFDSDDLGSDDSNNDELDASESEDNQIEGIDDADDDTHDPASDGEPDAAPGERAETENEFQHDNDTVQDNAVETTTVPMTDDDAQHSLAESASSEQKEND
ncbi:SMC-Scp complex subunit ScpB [Lysobacter fragariae]